MKKIKKHGFSNKVLTLIKKHNSEEWELYELGEKLYELETDANGIFGCFEDAHTKLQGEWITDNNLDWNHELQAYVTADGECYGEYEGPYGSNDWRDFFEYFAEMVLARARGAK